MTENVCGKKRFRDVTITAPASKSYAQRALVAALLARGKTTLNGISSCEDTDAVIKILESFGCVMSWLSDSTLLIDSTLITVPDAVNVGESALAARLFMCVAATFDKEITITGSGSLMSRPMDMVTKPLEQFGAEVDANNSLPITVRGKMIGGEHMVDSGGSSQGISGLLMTLPTLQDDSVLTVEKLKSTPYIDVTLDVLKAFGINILNQKFNNFTIAGQQHYTPAEYNIEGDWSAASCLLVAGAIRSGITINNLSINSLQADKAIIYVLLKAGAFIEFNESCCTVRHPLKRLKAFEFDATDCPDLFPALVALAANCQGDSTIRGVSRLINKESNRALALRDVFHQMGISVMLTYDDSMIVEGGEIRSAKVDSRGDHRIAMAVAAAVLGSEEKIEVINAEAVNKSYPKFWNEIAKFSK